MNKEFFCYGLFIIETLFSKLLKCCRIVPKNLEQYFSKHIKKASQASHKNILTSNAAASTQSSFCTSWNGIALALLKQWLICIQIFGLLSSGIDKKAANVEQEAASAVAAVYIYT